jgi:hypothetical protein
MPDVPGSETSNLDNGEKVEPMWQYKSVSDGPIDEGVAKVTLPSVGDPTVLFDWEELVFNKRGILGGKWDY